MSTMQIASEETLRAGRRIVEQYGSWSAAIAKGERRDDGVVILPAPVSIGVISSPSTTSSHQRGSVNTRRNGSRSRRPSGARPRPRMVATGYAKNTATTTAPVASEFPDWSKLPFGRPL